MTKINMTFNGPQHSPVAPPAHQTHIRYAITQHNILYLIDCKQQGKKPNTTSRQANTLTFRMQSSQQEGKLRDKP